MADQGHATIPVQSEPTAQRPSGIASTIETTKPKRAKRVPRSLQAPKILRPVRPSPAHRCPLHATAQECDGVRIAPDDEDISSRLVNPTLTFSGTPEMLRGSTVKKSNMLPESLFRTFYEISATLSSRVSKDTHVRHRENEQLKLREGNAFQTVGEVNFNKGVTKEGIERHLVWNKKRDPSTWISMFDELWRAKKRGELHYDESKRIGQRVTIAEISTTDLIPATLHGTCVTDWEIVIKERYQRTLLYYSKTIRQVAIPVWVNGSVRPDNGSSITAGELMASCADLFVCIKELRVSNLVEGPKTHSKRRTITADGHNFEWLALGRIRESRIVKVIPFDGSTFHEVKPSYTVRSAAATDDWIFDFDLETWRLESEMKKYSARKRKDKAEHADEDDAQMRADRAPKRKKTDAQMLDISPIFTIFTGT